MSRASRKGTRGPRWWTGAYAVLAAVCSLAGCGGTSIAPPGTAEVPSQVARSRFVRVADDAPPIRTPSSPTDDALRGTVEADGDGALGSRLQIRALRMPHPPRGASSRFNFGRGRRGWITAMPSAELLTSPAFHAGRVFLGGGFASHRFYAFNAYTGELDWSVAAPDGGPTAAIIEDGRVIFNTESCTIFVADAETGEIRWSRWLGDPLMSQPAAADGLVFSAYPKDGGHELGAFRLADGEPVWATRIPADVIQAPQVVDGWVYAATMDGTAHRIDASTGRVAWQRDLGASSAMWVDRTHVLVARRSGSGREPTEQMVTLRTSNGRVTHESARFPAPYLAGQSRDRQLATSTAGAWGDVPHGEHLGLRNVASGWAFQGSSPAVADGRAYFAISGNLVARDMATAETVWARRYAEAEGAQALSPPAVVGSLLVFGTVDGQLLATDIDTGMTVWAYDLGEPVVFPPIVAKGWVYVATGAGNVIGLELGDAMLDGWHMWGGNARHAGLVETAGAIDPRRLASLERPGRGTMRAVARSAPETERDEAVEGTPAEADAFEERELPLRGTDVEARVSGRVAEVFVTQHFENDGETPIEAVYLFPLPDDSAVDRMEMRIGERVIEGGIRGRHDARQTYRAARSEGRRAALLEQQRPNLFAQRVANIAPGERIDVRLRYVQTLPFVDGAYALTFPMVAPRRYDPGRGARDADALDDGSTTEAVSGRVDDLPPVTLRVEVDAGLPIARIASPTHERARIEHDAERRATVHLEAEGEDRGRDFVLRYAIGSDAPDAALLAHRADGDGWFSLLIQPPTAPDDAAIAPRDVTFVVDTSSSMRGRPLAQARATLRAVIEGLRPADRVNVIGFSDQVRAMAGAPVARADGALERARAFLDELRATGATEMVPAIERGLADAPAEEGRLPIVVLVTDGYIGNERDVLRSVATHLGDRRVYALGVGGSVNRFLVDRVADLGRGRAMVPALSAEPREVATRFAGLIDRPVFTDVAIDWGGLEVTDVYPRRLPDLFAAQPVVVHGRFRGGGERTVRVRGSVNGVRYERQIDVTLPEAATEDGPHASQATLWARAAVRDRMNRLALRDDEALIDEVRQLGLAHHLVTAWTSFVAVERVDEPAEPAGDDGEVVARPTVRPARALPGAPEIRVPAPEDARQVTLILPFGETLSATWEAELSLWSARFLIPRDAVEGTYPIEVLITHADGRLEHRRLWYTVDQSAARVSLRVEGDVRPGATVTLRAEQVITAADLAMVGRSPGELSEERATLLSDARRIEATTPEGDVLLFERASPNAWTSEYTVPSDAAGELRLDVTVVDLAANVTHQPLTLEVE
ncbi:MAG: VIT domain-containing protein [Sandaracinaceae bacterium]